MRLFLSQCTGVNLTYGPSHNILLHLDLVPSIFPTKSLLSTLLSIFLGLPFTPSPSTCSESYLFWKATEWGEWVEWWAVSWICWRTSWHDQQKRCKRRQAIQDLKVRKAAGPSGVTAEMIKAAGEQAVDWLTSICNRIVKEEAIPESWQMSAYIYKGKKDVLECSSSWGIKLHGNEGSRKSSREKVEAGSRDRQDAVWV